MSSRDVDEEVFAAAAQERRDVAAVLAGLDDGQAATPSLCAGWDVRTVGAHLVAAVGTPGRVFLLAVLRARGDLHRANDLVARREARRPVAELAALLDRSADQRSAPPVVGARGPLTDVLVHAGDIRVPLGLPHDPDPVAVRTCLDFVTTGRPVGFVPRGLLRGVRLTAPGLGWSWGDGPEVTGRGIDVLMAACGRRALLPRLTGPGVPVLAERLRAAAAGQTG